MLKNWRWSVIDSDNQPKQELRLLSTDKQGIPAIQCCAFADDILDRGASMIQVVDRVVPCNICVVCIPHVQDNVQRSCAYAREVGLSVLVTRWP